MNNMSIYEAVRSCPKEAQRAIQAGKLKGKTDINPMWRIKELTNQFGPCGIGWKTENEQFWTTPGANGEVIAWCSLSLRYKQNGEWSDPVFGIGGSMLVDTQRGSLASNDEAYKMAYTDAISVACKALGFAADIYWDKDSTKYSRQEAAQQAHKAEEKPVMVNSFKRCAHCGKPIKDGLKASGKVWPALEIAKYARDRWGMELCFDCCGEAAAAEKAEKAVSAGADGTL